jgi:hypothetical protein
VAKDSIHFAVTPDVRANLMTVFARGMVDGQDFTRHGKPSRSALLRYTIKRAADACAAPVSNVLALPEHSVSTDADRLKAAMARAGLTNATLGALIGVSRDVVKNGVRGLAMGPALRGWLAEQEEVGT